MERTPDTVAVVNEDQQLTYLQLNRRANQLAHFLRRSGVGPEVCVGVCMEAARTCGRFAAILKAGGAYVPLDPTYPKTALPSCSKTARRPCCLRSEAPGEPALSSGESRLC